MGNNHGQKLRKELHYMEEVNCLNGVVQWQLQTGGYNRPSLETINRFFWPVVLAIY